MLLNVVFIDIVFSMNLLWRTTTRNRIPFALCSTDKFNELMSFIEWKITNNEIFFV